MEGLVRSWETKRHRYLRRRMKRRSRMKRSRMKTRSRMKRSKMRRMRVWIKKLVSRRFFYERVDIQNIFASLVVLPIPGGMIGAEATTSQFTSNTWRIIWMSLVHVKQTSRPSKRSSRLMQTLYSQVMNTSGLPIQPPPQKNSYHNFSCHLKFLSSCTLVQITQICWISEWKIGE